MRRPLLIDSTSTLNRAEAAEAPADLILVRRFKNGEERAFNELVNRYKGRVYAVALRMVNDPEDAADLAQEAFVKAYQSIHRFQEKATFYTWLYRITVNLCLNHLNQASRRRRKQVSLEQAGPVSASEQSAPSRQVERRELAAALEQAMQTLPEKQRAVFVLRLYEALSFKEIAEVMNISVGGAKANYFHAAKKMQDLLQPYRL